MVDKLKNYFRTFYFSVAAITILAVTVLAFMLFWGNGLFQPSASAKKIYFADNISLSHRVLIEAFNNKNEGKIEVVPIDLPFEKFSTNERKELLIRYLRSKSDRIDIFSVDQIWVPRFAKWTEPLNRYITQPQREEIINEVLKTCYYKNDLVALPSYFDIGMMYVNLDELKKHTNYKDALTRLNNFITWEKFLELAGRYKNNGNPIYLFPADDYEGLMCSFIELVESQNGKIFEKDSVKLASPEAEKSLQHLVDLVNKYQLSPKSVLESRERECYREFVLKEGLFLRGWAGLDKWYKDNVGNKDVSKKYAIVPIPHFRDGKPASVIGGWNMMLSKYSKNKNEAFEFIKFMISEEAQKILFEKGGYIPIHKKVFEDPKLIANHPEISIYKKIIQTAVHRPFLDKYTRCSDVIAHYLNMAINKEIGVKNALTTAEKVINSGEFFIK